MKRESLALLLGFFKNQVLVFPRIFADIQTVEPESREKTNILDSCSIIFIRPSRTFSRRWQKPLKTAWLNRRSSTGSYRSAWPLKYQGSGRLGFPLPVMLCSMNCGRFGMFSAMPTIMSFRLRDCGT